MIARCKTLEGYVGVAVLAVGALLAVPGIAVICFAVAIISDSTKPEDQ